MVEITSAIDKKIAFFMFEQTLTVEEMARLLDMTANTLRSKRRGERDWTWGEILHLSDLLGITPNELAGIE